MEFDLNVVATRLGWAMLEKLAAEHEVDKLRSQVENLKVERDNYKHLLGGEADGQDIQGEGRQGS